MRQILGLKPTRNLLEGRLVLRAIGSVGQDVSAPQGPRVVSTRSQKRPRWGAFFLEAILFQEGISPQGAGGTRGMGFGIRASKVSSWNT